MVFLLKIDIYAHTVIWYYLLEYFHRLQISLHLGAVMHFSIYKNNTNQGKLSRETTLHHSVVFNMPGYVCYCMPRSPISIAELCYNLMGTHNTSLYYNKMLSWTVVKVNLFLYLNKFLLLFECFSWSLTIFVIKKISCATKLQTFLSFI